MPPRSPSALRSPALLLVCALVAGNALLRGGVGLLPAAVSAGVGAAALVMAVRRPRRSRGSARGSTGSPRAERAPRLRDAAGVATLGANGGAGSGPREDGPARPEPVEGRPESWVELPWPIVGLAAITLVVALQLVPLPPSVLALLSPESALLFARHLGPVGAWPAARPLSLDPGATALELAKCAGWTAIAAAAALLAGDRRRRNALLAAVALTGTAVVAVIYGARLFAGAPLLEPHLPFVNPNHLAGFLQLAAWVALGLAVRARGPARVGWLLAFAFSASGVFLSLSRGGIGAFVVGGGLFLALFTRTRRPEARDEAAAPRPWRTVLAAGPRAVARAAWQRSSALVPVAVSAAVGLAAFLAFDRIVSEMRTVSEASTTAVKLGLWPSAVQVIRAFPLAGIGKGAFATLFPAFKWEPLQATFTHVENEWLQLPVDLGLVAGVGAVALFAWTWLAAARRAELSRPVVGLLAGMGALAAHNLFDFSLEIPGVAIPFAIGTAVLAQGARAVRLPRWVLRTAAGALLALAAAGAALHFLHPPEADAARVAAAESADDAVALAREVLPWHPADWVPPAVVGTKLAGEFRCAEAEPWLARAMERDPTAPEPHRGAARCYAVAGRAQLAKREYRLAFSLGAPDALVEAHAIFDGPGELLEIAPDGPEGLVAAARILATDDPPQAREAWRRAWESFGDVRALAGLAAATLDAGEADAALELARRLEAAAPQEPWGFALAARALDAKDDDDGAVAELTAGAARFPGHAEVLVPLGVHHLKKRRFSQARVVFDRILARQGWAVAQKKTLVAAALEGQERYGEALRALRDAHEAAPDDPGPLQATARIAAKAGHWDEAIQALEEAARKPGVEPGRYAEQLERLRTGRTTAWAKQPSGLERELAPDPAAPDRSAR